jgi:hypothetical protein
MDGQQAGGIGIPVKVGGAAADSFSNFAAGSRSTVPWGSIDNAVRNHSETVAGLVKARTSISPVGGSDPLFAWDMARDAFEVF